MLERGRLKDINTTEAVLQVEAHMEAIHPNEALGKRTIMLMYGKRP